MRPSGAFSVLGWTVTRGRHVFVLLWACVAVLAYLYLPPLDDRLTGNLSDLVPEPEGFVSGPAGDVSPASESPGAPSPAPAEGPGTSEEQAPDAEAPGAVPGGSEEESAGTASLSGVVEAPALLVFTDPGGLDAGERAEISARLAALPAGPERPYRLVSAVPLEPETLGSGPSAGDPTALPALLFFESGISPTGIGTGTEQALERILEAGDEFGVEATGPAPAQNESADAIEETLPVLTLVTLAVIFVILAATYRSLVTPLVPLASIGLSAFLTLRLLAYFAERLEVQIPSQVEPVILVLLFGVGTDYALFLLSRTRQALFSGANRLDAAQEGVAGAGPVVFSSAAVLVAAFAVLVGAELEIYRTLGPGLGLALLTLTAVTLTLVPALLALFGRAAFGRRAFAGRRSGPASELRPKSRLVLRRPGLVAGTIVTALLVGTVGLFGLRIGFDQVGALPDDAPAARGYAALAEGFPAGILAPVNVIVSGEDLVASPAGLDRLRSEMWASGGYAAVIGPEDAGLVPGVEFVSADGTAARFVLVFYDDPYSPRSLDQVQNLRDALPQMLERSGLDGARAEVGGQVVLASEARAVSNADLVGLAPLVFGVAFLVLALLLRTPVAPVYLLAATALGFAATLGAATVFFQGLLGQEGLVYYVPFALFLLLVALGSDYNIFIMAAIREEIRNRPLREAVSVALSRTGRTINAAGLALSASFALLALIPLDDFRQIGLTVAAGILLDTFVIRPLLVPAFVLLVGRAGFWPAKVRE